MSTTLLSVNDLSETKTNLQNDDTAISSSDQSLKLPSSSRNNLCKWAVLYYFILQGTCVGIYSSQVSVFRDALDISDVTLGIITSLVYLGYVTGAPVSAGICRSIGSMRTVLIASQFFGLNFAIVGITGNINGSNVYLLGIAFYLFGVVMGIMDVAGNSQGILVEVLRNVSCFGLFHGSYAGAVAVGTVVGGALMYFFGDGASVYICVCSGLLLASIAVPLTRNHLYNHRIEKAIEKSKKVAEKRASSSNFSSDSVCDMKRFSGEKDPSLSTSLLREDDKFDNVNERVNSDGDESQDKEPFVQCIYPTGVLRLSCMTGFLGSFAEGGFLGMYVCMYAYVLSIYTQHLRLFLCLLLLSLGTRVL